MRVAWLLPDLTLSGGAGIVIQHARQVQRHHGMESVLVRTKESGRPDWAYPGLEELRVASLADAASERFDVAVATWWETAMDLFALEASRYAYFLQLLENSHYPPGESERLGFQLTLGLPVRFITASSWITRTVERLQPGNAAFYVLSGMDKETWAPPEAPPEVSGPLRIVVEGGLDLIRKGVPHALEAVSRMSEPRHVTLVTPGAPEAPSTSVDEHVGGIPHAEMAALFARSHVLLKLSRAEGMYGPPLEAFHMGATCVTNPVPGHDEYIRHLDNALVVDWDDPAGTARALDLLARDRDLLERLRRSALETAKAWPAWEPAGAEMAEILRTIVAEPPPPARAAGLRAGADIQSVLAASDRQWIEQRDAKEALAGLREQRAVRTALEARRVATPVIQKARGLRARLRPR